MATKLMLCEVIEKLMPCSYIANEISLKNERKMKKGSCIAYLILQKTMFVVQDETQSYHWGKTGCTLHIVALYYLNKMCQFGQKLSALFQRTDDHDTCFVYKVQLSKNLS